MKHSSVRNRLFISPEKSGRKITVIFSYIQRIGKQGTYNVRFLKELKKAFKGEWAAVRQFELLHESGNHKIYDLNPELLQRSMLDLAKSMRAGGYRIVVATIGTYENETPKDELAILDSALQEEISQMLHMLYLQEESEQQSLKNKQRIENNKWEWQSDLPHIALVLGAEEVMHWDIMDETKKKNNKLGRRFFDIISKLPHNHIVHDTAIGLQLPELNGENQWNYIADSEETLLSFNLALNNIFDKFNHISLSSLHGREDAKSEVKPSFLHMRGYGDRLNRGSDAQYRVMACNLGN
ncbi:MAG: hypothetical protein FWF23_04055 [Alphaproteobacteria bacterium]|nr:hypothetical protein [Alphaproteobacteria bacterium]MCL2504869.1 hypothetical protein [Alphaproteobacteria bacterium]